MIRVKFLKMGNLEIEVENLRLLKATADYEGAEKMAELILEDSLIDFPVPMQFDRDFLLFENLKKRHEVKLLEHTFPEIDDWAIY